MPGGPDFSVKEQDDSVTLALAGRWTVDESASMESRADALAAPCAADVGNFDGGNAIKREIGAKQSA